MDWRGQYCKKQQSFHLLFVGISNIPFKDFLHSDIYVIGCLVFAVSAFDN
jgi:hypothetical protein